MGFCIFSKCFISGLKDTRNSPLTGLSNDAINMSVAGRKTVRAGRCETAMLWESWFCKEWNLRVKCMVDTSLKRNVTFRKMLGGWHHGALG